MRPRRATAAQGQFEAASDTPSQPTAPSRLVLTESRRLRFGSFSALYFAQGVPIGLLSIAIPNWLAQHGATQGQIATFVLWIGLPWALKLFIGPFMDRFTFLPMGFRRPWVIALQGGLVLSMLVLAVVGVGFEHGADGSLVALTAAGTLVNTFAATQDVAVDGMAIDVLPENERGRANAFMGFGQTTGRAALGALCGTLLAMGGIAAGALACAVTVAVVFVLATVLRERPGERLLPWTEGAAAPRQQAPPRMLANLGSVGRALVLPMSLVAIGVEFVSRIRDGAATALFPVLATQGLGIEAEQFSHIQSIVGFSAAVLAVCLGPAIDAFGAKRLLLLSLFSSAAVHLVAGLAPVLWENQASVLALFCLSEALTQLVFVCVIALFMNLCWRPVAATQFAVYMALANLGRSTGAGLLALIEGHLDDAQLLLAMAGLLAVAGALLLLFNEEAHKRRLGRLDERLVGSGPTATPDEAISPAHR